MQRCPICATEVPEMSRYPRYVCRECAERACAADGRRLTFSNVDVSGGFAAFYVDTGAPHASHECFVDGVRCHADEAHLGGIVIEAID